MFRVLTIIWILLPFGLLAWQQAGPGRDLLLEDRAGLQIRQASQYADKHQWHEAATAYSAAQQELPTSATILRYRLKFAQAQALTNAGDLDSGRNMLRELLDEMSADPHASPDLREQVRHELAIALYYGAWRMRLEGGADKTWSSLADNARQQFRELADAADRQATSESYARNTEAQRRLQVFRSNLEAAIKLRNMHLTDLQEKVLPDTYTRGLELPASQSLDPVISEDSSEHGAAEIPADTRIQ